MSSTTSMIPVSRYNDALKTADKALQKYEKVKDKTEEKVGEVFKLAETIGGALAVGALRGKYGEITIGPGIPAEVAVGGALTFISFIDLPGKHSEHLHNLANGILGSWAAIEAVKMAGGVVLSKEDVDRLQNQTSEKIESKETKLLSGQQTPTARETIGTPQNGVRTEEAKSIAS